jgi:hypothetical protein
MMDSMHELEKGDVLRHPTKPEWGRGVVVATKGSKAQVFFENLTGDRALKLDTSVAKLQHLPKERVPLLERLRLKEKDGSLVLDSRRVSFDSLFEHFKAECPKGFEDPKLLAKELKFKRAARTAYLEHFGDDRLEKLVEGRDAKGLAKGFDAVLGAQQVLLSPKLERDPFGEAMHVGKNALPFARGLLEYLSEAPSAKTFDALVKALEDVKPTGKQKLTTWPLLTLFPFLARPSKDMFVKPGVTQKAADLVGIDIDYDAALNWKTYQGVIRFAKNVDHALATRGLEPKDFIETQSFVWVAVEFP